MGYYICPTQGYYEGNGKQHPDDTEIFIPRPHYVCTWNGVSWDYPLAASKRAAKDAFGMALEAYLYELSSYYGITQTELHAASIFGAERRYLADNPGATDAQLPLLAGYALQMGGGATKATASAEYASDFDAIAAMHGKLIAYRFDRFAAIDACVNGSDAVAIVFDGADIV